MTVNANGTVTQARNQIEVYFNNDDLNEASAETVTFYQLIDTKGTVSNLDDAMHNPASVAYDAAADKAILTFSAPLDTLPGFGPGTYSPANRKSVRGGDGICARYNSSIHRPW